MNLREMLLAETDHEKLQKEKGYVADITSIDLLASLKTLPRSIFFENKDVYISKHNRYADYPLHSHQFLEINYMFSGSCIQEINGEKHKLHTGDILLMDVGSYHSIRALSRDDILINILFENTSVSINSLADIQGQKSLVHKLLLNKNSNSRNFIIIKTDNNPNIRSILNQMISEYFLPSDFSTEIVSHYLPILLYEFARSIEVYNQDEMYADINPVYLRVVELIDKNYKDISLERAANMLSYNKNYLSNLVKDQAGITFTDLVIQRRLMEAKMMVVSTNMPIYKIAEQCGFSNRNQFYSKYKRAFGILPLEDRKDNN